MNKSNSINDKIKSLGNETFEKLQTLNIPPYPKYYHDTFLEKLYHTEDNSLIALTKNYTTLFSINDEESSIEKSSIELAKFSLDEFAKSNSNLQEISDQNVIDITSIKQEPENIHTDKVLRLFESFQTQVFHELKNAQETIAHLQKEVERLEKESHTDPLTKIYNRRVLISDLEKLIKEGEGNKPFYFALLDADDFKDINDKYGHIAGDKTLIFLSKLLKNSLEKNCKVYRYGGEEFAIIIQDCNEDEAAQTIQSILSEVDESKLLFKGHHIHLTLSAGMTESAKDADSEQLLEKADKALYEAKNCGKNCLKVEN